MKQFVFIACFAAAAALFPHSASAQHPQFNAMIATHAQANGVPEALVHRVILRESRYQPGVVGRGGAMGLMQIKLATARGLGYTGTAEGLREQQRLPRAGNACAYDANGGIPPYWLRTLVHPCPFAGMTRIRFKGSPRSRGPVSKQDIELAVSQLLVGAPLGTGLM